jgi:hypothetical protein
MAICSVLLMVMVMMVNKAVAPPQPPAFPVYDETFSVDTAESTPGVGVVLRQTIVHDWTLRRSMMKAEGSLVRGVLQQILRCVTHVTCCSSSTAIDLHYPYTHTRAHVRTHMRTHTLTRI